jgi:MFS superfamily sulfate permease-like transporter
VRELSRMRPKPKQILLAAEPVTDIDTTAADMLIELNAQLRSDNIVLKIAELKDPVRERLERYELAGHRDPDSFYPTLEAAVDSYQKESGAEWTATKHKEKA